MTPAVAVATLAGIGRLRPAPGTWGSLVVLPAVLLGPLACLALAVLVTVAGWVAVRDVLAQGAATGGGDQDPGWIVVDEAAGMLLALAALPHAGWIGVVAAFALFRAFDILKPWPVSWADGLHGATGVMLDDVIAGAMAGAVLILVSMLVAGGL